MPRRMLWSALTHSPSSLTSTVAAYWSAPRRISSASAVALGDDLLRPELRGTRQLPLLDEERGLLLGTREDALGLLLGALDEARRLLVDALGLADLLGHGDTQLVDEVERAHLVHDHGIGHGHAAAVRDQRFEAFDEEDDVDGRGPGAGRSSTGLYRTRPAPTVGGGEAPPAGTIELTSPPRAAISRTMVELT